MYRLFVYADSSELDHVERELLASVENFTRAWPVEGVRVTNRKAPLMEDQGTPDWNLGLRVETHRLTRENVEALLLFVSEMSRRMNFPFVLGTWDRSSNTRDLCFVDGHVPDAAAGRILEGAHAV